MRITNSLSKVLALSAMGATYMIAMAADNSCWHTHYPECPGGVSSENGRTCGRGGLITVSDNVHIDDDFVCTGHSRSCPNAGNDCNEQQQWHARWRDVNCVNYIDGNPVLVFQHYCLDGIIWVRDTGNDCSGKKCRPAVVAAPASPMPN